ncbi:uncharacterized protein JCM10292_007622 [Rhodotorula paludigena]|uniref:uncharacterized protein n=1 Tax=Rhodotorula paludigena TaxID=86838 RepID=UPI003171888C
MAAAPSLADPSIMLAHERTDELVKCVERDDLLGVLLVLCYCVDDEVNGKASAFPITPLETAVCYPTRRFAIRRLIVECLLHRGASPDEIVRKPAASAHAALLSVLRGWRSGGREQASIAYQLCFVLSLEEAETYTTDNGLGPDGPHDPPPAASTGPPSGEASTSTAPRQAPPTGPRADRVPREGVAGAPQPSSHWIYVGRLPLQTAERWIYDKLAHAGTPANDIFLSKARNQPSRFAFVGFITAQAAQLAVRILEQESVHGNTVSATRFRDRNTGSTQPHISEADLIARRYVGAQRHAALPPTERRTGLFLLHLPPGTTESEIYLFLRRSVPAAQIGAIEVRRAGLSVLAFADVPDEQACQRAIVGLDGEALGGYGVRVSWLEPRSLWSPTQHAVAAAMARYRDFLENEKRSSAARPTAAKSGSTDESILGGINEQSRTHELGLPEKSVDPRRKVASPAAAMPEPSPHASPSLPVPESVAVSQKSSTSLSTARNALSHDASASSSTIVTPSAAPARSSDAQNELDVQRLRSLGMDDEQIKAIERIWTPVHEPPAQTDGTAPFDRSVQIQVRFGHVTRREARAALEHNAKAPAFPDDAAMQARYEAFLRSQAGESRDWYTVFFAQLADFNRSSAAFTAKARELVSSAAAGADERNKMEVDESSVKQEE